MEPESRNHEERKQELEPIRGSIVTLVVKLAMLLFLFEVLYAAIYYFVNLGFSLPFDLHHHIAWSLFAFEILKILMELYLIVYVTLAWANNAYYLAGKHLIRRKGIVHVEEDVFHFDNIRSISVDQSFLGRIFHYGDITLKTSASGGYQGDIVMMEIADPKRYEEKLREYF